jgi:hypothetical protein
MDVSHSRADRCGCAAFAMDTFGPWLSTTTLETALMATRREDLRLGTNAAYVHGCACRECREHQRICMASNR